MCWSQDAVSGHRLLDGAVSVKLIIMGHLTCCLLAGVARLVLQRAPNHLKPVARPAGGCVLPLPVLLRLPQDQQ